MGKQVFSLKANIHCSCVVLVFYLHTNTWEIWKTNFGKKTHLGAYLELSRERSSEITHSLLSVLIYKKWSFALLISLVISCVKNVQIRSFFWSVFSRIWTEYGDLRSTEISEYGKIWSRKNSVFGQFSRRFLRIFSDLLKKNGELFLRSVCDSFSQKMFINFSWNLATSSPVHLFQRIFLENCTGDEIGNLAQCFGVTN